MTSPTMNTFSADKVRRMKRDMAQQRADEIVADMEAQTSVTELMSRYGLEMLCARQTLEVELGILLGNTPMVQELRQKVTDELASAFPYSDALIREFARDLIYFYGSLAAPQE